MEKSFLSFRANHPDWKPSADGEELISRLASFRNQTIAQSMSASAVAASASMGMGPNDTVRASEFGGSAEFSAASSLASSSMFSATTAASHLDSSRLARSGAGSMSQHIAAMRDSMANLGLAMSINDTADASMPPCATVGNAIAASHLGSNAETSCYYWLDKYYSHYDTKSQTSGHTSTRPMAMPMCGEHKHTDQVTGQSPDQGTIAAGGGLSGSGGSSGGHEQGNINGLSHGMVDRCRPATVGTNHRGATGGMMLEMRPRGASLLQQVPAGDVHMSTMHRL
jgi:hypothetical protein